MIKVTVGNRQTIWDIAIQEYGSPEGILQLIDDNPNVLTSVDDALTPGTVLNIKGTPVDNQLVAALKSGGIKLATGGDESLFSTGPYLLTEDLQPILTESQTPILIEEGAILSEDGINITTEDGDNLLTE